MTLEEKQHAIDKICDQQRAIIADAAKIVSTDIHMALAMCLRAQMMEAEKSIIGSTPIPKYRFGSSHGAICQETIMGPDGSIFKAR